MISSSPLFPPILTNLFPSMTPTTYILLISLLAFTGDAHTNHPITTSVYLSPKTFISNYNNMITSFKIFIYPLSTSPTQLSQFHESLAKSRFVTQDPNEAHLFFIPFNSSISTRNLARLIKSIRVNFPFWNRTLGADHFYISSSGVDSSSDRNIVELKKNSIQISDFPTPLGFYIPHKDITFPPSYSFTLKTLVNKTKHVLGYMKLSQGITLTLLDDIKSHPDFEVRSLDINSKFCLFVYDADISWIVEAMSLGCVPVVISGRAIQDLPLMDVIDWSKIAVFVGQSGGAKGLKKVLDGIESSRYDEMVQSGVVAVQHLVWNAEPKAYDAFHMIVYQLWLRRHTVRYARWVEQ